MADVIVIWGEDSRNHAMAVTKALSHCLDGSVFFSDDIAPGREWRAELTEALRTAQLGVACLTKGVIDQIAISRAQAVRGWITFEHGALYGRGVDIVPVLFGDLEPHDVGEFFGARQCLKWPEDKPAANDEAKYPAELEDVYGFVQDLNRTLGMPKSRAMIRSRFAEGMNQFYQSLARTSGATSAAEPTTAVSGGSKVADRAWEHLRALLDSGRQVDSAILAAFRKAMESQTDTSLIALETQLRLSFGDLG